MVRLYLILILGIFSGLGFSVRAEAQNPAVDPIYIAAPGTMAEAQVARLQAMGADWAQLGRYREENAKLAAPAAGEKRVVFYGDSITDAWGRKGDGVEFFPGKPWVNRGISGQTTPQMLVRFRQDVVALKPAAVVILAGTNDIAGNTGYSTLEMIEDNFASMCEIAKANHIKVVLASVLPVSEYPWRPGVHPAEKIKTLNTWLKGYAAAHKAVYLDYWSAMANAEGGLDKELAPDGVHPTPKGYGLMAPLAEKAVAKAIGK